MARARALLLVATLVPSACSRRHLAGADSASAIVVTCSPARQGTVAATIHLRGVLTSPPDRQAFVSSPVAGPLSSVTVREGDTVRAGQIVATVDDAQLASMEQEALAGRNSARAAEARARTSVERARRLYAEGVLAKKDLEDAEAQASVALASLDTSEAQVHQTVLARQRATLRAPIAGVVVRVFRRPGELVDGSAATPVAEIADPTQLELRADVQAGNLVDLSTGAQATLAIDALPGMVVRAHVVAVSPAVDLVTSLGRVRLGLDVDAATHARLRLGMPASADLTGAPREGVVVDPRALRRSPDGVSEVVVCRPSATAFVAEVRDVSVGQRALDAVEISDGLAAGELVVVDRVVGLVDGAPLQAASR